MNKDNRHVKRGGYKKLRHIIPNFLPPPPPKPIRPETNTEFEDLNAEQAGLKDLVEAILKITNESRYKWHTTDSNEAEQIEQLLRQHLPNQ